MVKVPNVDEREHGPPRTVALENAARKAHAVARAGATVLGADTVVQLGGRIYGKPSDSAQARATLAALSGKWHEVISAICVVAGGRQRGATATTRVRFRELDRAAIDWYLESGEWRGRAGGYAIQGRGGALVAAIDGEYLNVVGLPVGALLQLEPSLLWR